MDRQNLQLLALARSGDPSARCEVARRYLLGSAGFPRDRSGGIEYLSHPAVAALPAAIHTVAECMTLDEILQARLLGTLQRAVNSELSVARTKLAAWLLARHPASDEGATMLKVAARQGHAAAQAAIRAMSAVSPEAAAAESLAAVLHTLQQHGMLNGLAVAIASAREALEAGELWAAGTVLAAAARLDECADHELSALVVQAIDAAETAGVRLPDLPVQIVEPMLDARACAGDRIAANALGRALCGIDLGHLPASDVAESPNVRKGAALLLRAADAGCDESWMHLYRLHADRRSSVANPQMARFFLEKAATRGVVEAQRLLGALILRGATTLQESEQALGWLHEAAHEGDGHARQLLHSLVLPLEGADEDAERAIATLEQHDRWLAGRLRVARDFGLTKLEALCFEPVEGLRPWGLVVGKNPFILQIRLSAPRAIPAITQRARDRLRAVAELFARTKHDEGDMRRRSHHQRRLFAKLGLEESWFFATASSVALESFRLGTKWAFRARQPLRMALAA
ncbi:MAG: sel1 repeat family protein [Paucibacter sp.]|nr:sel1 repeat family protein [Roseateles sp.]